MMSLSGWRSNARDGVTQLFDLSSSGTLWSWQVSVLLSRAVHANLILTFIQTLLAFNFFCISTDQIQGKPQTHPTARYQKKYNLSHAILLDSVQNVYFLAKASIKLTKSTTGSSKVSPQSSGKNVFVFHHLWSRFLTPLHDFLWEFNIALG